MAKYSRRITAPPIDRCLIYYRVSSEEQARDGQSLLVQLEDCRTYSQGRGWAIVGEYHDILTGSNPERPGYQALLAEARRLAADGRPVAVVVRWLHRLGRQVLESVRCREEFKRIGVPIHSVGEGGEVSDFVANIMASVAEYELEQLSDRVVAVWDGIAAKGWAKTSPPPWGYYWRPATKAERAEGAPNSVLDVDTTAAPYVKELFERAASGVSIRSLQPWATNLPGAVRGGRKMSRRTINDMLRSPIYAARPFRGAEDVLSRPVTRWPALVSDETWAAVRDRIEGFTRVPRRASNRFLLTGFLRCPACGSRMRGQAPQQRYRCGGTDSVFKGAVCWQTVNMPRADSLVIDLVGDLLDRITADRELQRALERDWDAGKESKPKGQDVARQLQARIENARANVDRATDLLIQRAVKQDAYDRAVQRALADADAARDELERLRRQPPPPRGPSFAEFMAVASSWSSVFRGAAVDVQREALALFVERVVAVREQQGVYRIDVTWTPLGRKIRSAAGLPLAVAA
jgi:DNA invertase Pin-like site-specific DNA recombinase